jgi:hypothetical protein
MNQALLMEQLLLEMQVGPLINLVYICVKTVEIYPDGFLILVCETLFIK